MGDDKLGVGGDVITCCKPINVKGLTMHAQQLCVGGGGLLTRVWLLMPHLPLTNHSQIPP